jgi:uncharacterized protein (TIGR02246 family)
MTWSIMQNWFALPEMRDFWPPHIKGTKSARQRTMRQQKRRRGEWHGHLDCYRICRTEDLLMNCRSEKRRAFALNFCGCVALALVAAGCGQQAPPDTRAADESAIRDLDVKWSSVAAAKDLEGTVSYYADDASLLPPNASIETGKTAIHAAWAELLGSVDSITWQPNKIEVSRSSDMAYLIGAYQLKSKDANGRTVDDHGKYVEVWKKQADGNWKVVADIFNSDLLPPTPVATAKKK